ncbi:MAG: hypothetical protein QHH15_06655 [Candidatus Thermoplasmatota archaeon]|jgi:hypothetical protein|nr:hypothetical protein [Candidatus Thermoplasmatota archaeon]
MNFKKNYVITGIITIVIVLSVTLIGAAILQNDCQLESGYKDNNEAIIVGIGTIKYLDLEGGFYGIVSEDGKQYLPCDLSVEYQQDGLYVKFKLKPLEDIVGIHMWGLPVEIVEIQIIE